MIFLGFFKWITSVYCIYFFLVEIHPIQNVNKEFRSAKPGTSGKVMRVDSAHFFFRSFHSPDLLLNWRSRVFWVQGWSISSLLSTRVRIPRTCPGMSWICTLIIILPRKTFHGLPWTCEFNYEITPIMCSGQSRGYVRGIFQILIKNLPRTTQICPGYRHPCF